MVAGYPRDDAVHHRGDALIRRRPDDGVGDDAPGLHDDIAVEIHLPVRTDGIAAVYFLPGYGVF